VYSQEENEQVTENIPSLATLNSALSIVSTMKTFFDRVEVEGVTSHLSFLNYLVLDLSLLTKQTDSPEPSVRRKLCADLRGQMEEKLWAYCGSPFAQSAAFLTGIDILKKIMDYMAQFTRCSSQPQKGFCVSWLKIAADHDAVVDNYLDNLYSNCAISENAASTSSYQTTTQKQRIGDMFEDMFTTQPDGPDGEDEPEVQVAKKKRKVSTTPLLAEIKEFRDSRIPMRDPSSFWKFSRLARLKVCAKIIFSAPVSSAGIERLFSQAGMLLTKQRKRMLPKVMKKLVYIRYEKKYRKWMERLGVSVSEKELKKGIEEDGADGYDAEVPDED